MVVHVLFNNTIVITSLQCRKFVEYIIEINFLISLFSYFIILGDESIDDMHRYMRDIGSNPNSKYITI